MKAVLLLTVAVGALLGQQHNYTSGDVEEGGRLYRINCIGCHGPEGNLVSGIDLGRNRFRRVSSDDEIVDVIMNGVPGTGMPPNAIVRLRAYNVVAYLRNMNATSGPRSVAAATGDAGRGKVLFEGKGACNTCHRVFGEGSRSGPDLSEAGLTLRAIEIETSILDPNARISTTSPPFRVVKKDGTVVSGLLLNQDVFSVQLLDEHGALASLQKSDLRESGLLKVSPMPSYATGRVFWTYNYTPSALSRLCCGRVNRGVAIAGDTLLMGTIDARLIAVDARNRKPLWNREIAKPEQGYAITQAPLVIKDKVIIGVAGGEYGIRGFIGAYDVITGKEMWRFYTIPGKGEPGHETWSGDSWKTGGASAWVTGSYDAALNLTCWGIGNPGPDWNGDSRAGDNLYSDSVVALDADTGSLKWHYRFTPHDEFDYDATQVPVLADVNYQGRERKVIMTANRNGIYYVIDRSSGQFLAGKPFTKVTWMSGFDDKGRPIRVPGQVPTLEGTRIYPSNQGGTNWYSPSYSPNTGLFYIPAWDNTWSIYVKGEEEYTEGQRFTSGMHRSSFALNRGTQNNTRSADDGHGAVMALDAATGEKKWQFDFVDVTDSGLLTTATDLLFSGNREEFFFALDARSGQMLWKSSLGGAIANGPMTYAVNGRQYVAVAAGNSLYVFGLRRES